MKPFTDVLRDIRKGKVVDALTDDLAEVVQAVLDTEKAGELTLKLKVKPQGKGDLCVVIEAKITSKLPHVDMPEGIFFADLDGGLHRDEPNQHQMFKDVDLGDVIDKETGEITTRKGA